MSELLPYFSALMFVVSTVIAAVAIGKVKAAEAWKEVAIARKEEIEVRDTKIITLTDKVEARDETIKELTANTALSMAEIEKLKGQPNLALIVDSLKEFRAADDRRYEAAMVQMNNRFAELTNEIDRRFNAFADKLHEYHVAELAQLGDIATRVGQ